MHITEPRLAVAWWLGVAALALGVIVGGADLPIADHDPAARGALIGYVPRGAVQAAVAVLALVLAVAGAWMLRAQHLAAAGRVTAARTGRAGLLAAAWTLPAALALAVLDTHLLALAGYLPLLLVLAPFDAEFRAALAQAVEPGYLLQLLTVAGLALWAGAVIRYQRATAVPGPGTGGPPRPPSSRPSTRSPGSPGSFTRWASTARCGSPRGPTARCWPASGWARSPSPAPCSPSA